MLVVGRADDGSGQSLGGSGSLDWSLFDDPERLGFVSSIPEPDAASSASLQRVARVAATATGSRYSQVSLIGTAQFVPAAHGLTYTAADQHTPIRDSLCSVTMASGAPLRVDDTRDDPRTRHLPPVTERGVETYLGVPLRDPDGRAIGALCVFDAERRTWTDADEALLLDLAHLVTRELHLLAALETATMTEVRLRNVITELVDRPKLAKSTSLEARAHYLLPAGAPAGGDWIDWIELGDRTAFSIGDVAGHGLTSIVVMEELRHALRAYAFESVEPTDAIVKTSEFLRQMRPGQIATAIKADVSLATGRTRFAVAGHPPPIYLHHGRASLVPVRPGPPLGVLTTPPAVAAITLAPGDRILVYTDGVFERRREPLDAGLARLVAAMERHADTTDVDVAARAILHDSIEELHDDACLLLVERPATSEPTAHRGERRL